MEEKRQNELNNDAENASEVETNETIIDINTTQEAPEAVSAEASEAPVDKAPDPIKTPETSAPIVSEPPVTYAYRWDYTEQNQADKAKRPSNAHGLRNFAIIMTVAFVLAIGTLIGVLLLDDSLPSSSSVGDPLDILYDQCSPSYVAISVVSELGTSGCGSGIILTGDGYIATNYHVVEGAKSLNVILHDGTKVEAEYVDGDDLNDIAIIKINKRNLIAATLGSSASVRVGDKVMAIGTPYSIQYRGTMTSGYISALDRKYAAKNENGTVNKVITLLQTDTSVNPGNSGGPLFNMDGEVIGIVSMKIAGSEYEGMGFAIPIDGVRDMLFDIIKHGKLTISNGGSAFEGAALGISGFTVEKDVTYMLAGDYHYEVVTDENGDKIVKYVNDFGVVLPIPMNDTELLEDHGITEYTLYTAPAGGVLIMATSEGFDSADKLKPDDIILSANGISCAQIEALQEIIASCRVGDKLELEVWRNNKTVSVTVELGRSASME